MLEGKLKSLMSPVWPQEILGTLNKERVERGEHLFDAYCSQCHAEIDRADPDRRVVAHISSQREVGTDDSMARNGATYMGYSGILRNQYTDVGMGNILLDQKAPIAALLNKATLSVIATPDTDKWFGHRLFDWAYDLVFALRNNEISASLKRGNYDRIRRPTPSPRCCPTRALAQRHLGHRTYLHNGSVPTLYDLLLPKRRPGDPDGEYRPDIPTDHANSIRKRSA